MLRNAISALWWPGTPHAQFLQRSSIIYDTFEVLELIPETRLQ